MSLPICKIVAAAAGLTALLCVAGVPARATDQAPISQGAYQTPVVLPSRLQVTGTADKISLDTEHADVQSVLKAVLKQAGKQFEPDATVAGQVTLLLTDQSLDNVLRAICSQTYLRYQRTPEGVYRFSRDEEAIKNAFSRLYALNALLRQQLRTMGFEVPTDAALAQSAEPQASKPGIGGGLTPNLQERAKTDSAGTTGGNRSIRRLEASPANGAVPQGPAGPAGPAGFGAPAGAAGALPQTGAPLFRKDAQNGVANIHTNFANQADLEQFLGPGTVPSAQDYQLFLRRNNFVWFNIPEEKPASVSSVLQQFSQQSNVPILLDQSIPNSLKFRVWGSLSPRQLPEALNLLAPTAHLQWRWIGNSIFVFPAPDFQVILGEVALPRNALRYPYNSMQQRGQNEPAAGRGAPESQDKKSGGKQP